MPQPPKVSQERHDAVVKFAGSLMFFLSNALNIEAQRLGNTTPGLISSQIGVLAVKAGVNDEDFTAIVMAGMETSKDVDKATAQPGAIAL